MNSTEKHYKCREIIDQGIYDVHFHYGQDAPWIPETDHSVNYSQMKKILSEFNVKKAVIFPNPVPNGDYSDNAEHDFNIKNDTIIPFIRFDPKNIKNSLKLITQYIPLGLKGVKLHPVVEFFRPDHKALFPIYEIMEENNLILLIHTSSAENNMSYSNHLIPVGENFRKLKIILAHLNFKSLSLIDRFENFYGDTSCSRDGSLEIGLSKYNEKILYGSDYPYSDPQKEIERILEFSPSNNIIEKIFRNNFLSLFGENK